MMNGLEKSDLCIRAEKLANICEGPELESMEQRRRAEGNTGTIHTHRTQSRVSVTLERVCVRRRTSRDVCEFVNHPRWEPGAPIAPAGFCAGGTQ